MQPVNFSEMPGIPISSASAEGIPQLIPVNDTLDSHMDSVMDSIGFGTDQAFNWELISLGLEEPLPNQDVIDEMCVLLSFSPLRNLTTAGTRYISRAFIPLYP